MILKAGKSFHPKWTRFHRRNFCVNRFTFSPKSRLLRHGGKKNVSKDLGKLCVREADLCHGTGRFFNLAVSFTYGSQSWKRRTNIYYAEYKQGFSFPGFVFQHGGCVLHMPCCCDTKFCPLWKSIIQDLNGQYPLPVVWSWICLYVALDTLHPTCRLC